MCVCVHVCICVDMYIYISLYLYIYPSAPVTMSHASSSPLLSRLVSSPLLPPALPPIPAPVLLAYMAHDDGARKKKKEHARQDGGQDGDQ